MKLLISLSSYGDKNLHLLNRVVDEYKTYTKYDINIEVHCTVPVDRSDIVQTIHTNPSTTSLFHRQDFISKQDNYDLFLFAEYDMLIKESAIDTYLKHEKTLPINYCLGFIRYENTPEESYLIDLWRNIPGYNYIQDSLVELNGLKYFTLSNVHQAAYVVTRNQLKYIIANTQYDISSLDGYGPELASSGIFASWPIGPRGIMNKVLPLDRNDLENCFIHHTADCHCNEPGVNTDPITFRNNTISKRMLFENLSL